MSVQKISTTWLVRSHGAMKVLDVPDEYEGEPVEVVAVDGRLAVVGIATKIFYAISDRADVSTSSVSLLLN